uniref:Secreted protein n=1 Tax=Setaria italica TaxID=4555 RepID=K3XS27_SETIT
MPGVPRKGLRSLLLLLWLERNARTFQRTERPAHALLSQIRGEARTWKSAGAKHLLTACCCSESILSLARWASRRSAAGPLTAVQQGVARAGPPRGSCSPSRPPVRRLGHCVPLGCRPAAHRCWPVSTHARAAACRAWL